MEHERDINELREELKKVNELIKIETNNLIYLLKHVNIENIYLLNFHYKFNELINKRDYLEKEIFNLKY